MRLTRGFESSQLRRHGKNCCTQRVAREKVQILGLWTIPHEYRLIWQQLLVRSIFTKFYIEIPYWKSILSEVPVFSSRLHIENEHWMRRIFIPVFIWNKNIEKIWPFMLKSTYKNLYVFLPQTVRTDYWVYVLTVCEKVRTRFCV